MTMCRLCFQPVQLVPIGPDFMWMTRRESGGSVFVSCGGNGARHEVEAIPNLDDPMALDAWLDA